MFEIEKMESEFDYSLVDNDTADFLRSCEYEINGIAEDARVKFGTVLIKAKEKLSNGKHGIFRQWHESGGISKDDANYFMNLSSMSRNLDNKESENLLKAPKTVQKKVMQKNAPEDLKQSVYNGDITTNKEYEKAVLEKEQAQRRAEEAERKAKEQADQLEHAQRSQDILQNKLDAVENEKPEYIEVEKEVIKEVVPEDYERTKQALEDFKKKFNRESKSAEALREELKKYTEAFSDPNSAYEESQVKRLERESNINAYKLSIGIQKFIEDNAVETYKVSSVIKSNEAAKKRLEENIELLEDFTTNIKALINGRIITH